MATKQRRTALDRHVTRTVYHVDKNIHTIQFVKVQGKYEGWNFNFGNTPLDWIQELLE